MWKARWEDVAGTQVVVELYVIETAPERTLADRPGMAAADTHRDEEDSQSVFVAESVADMRSCDRHMPAVGSKR